MPHASSSLETLLPESIWREPQPLVAIIGDVDWDPNIHKRLSNALYSVGLDQHSTGNISVPLCYQSLARDHVFPPRKAHHPMKAGSGQPMEGYTARGILKTHWPQKHTQQIPSAIILVACAEMHWGLLEWGARETTITESLERLKAALGSRDVRIFTALIKRGMGDDREWDERIMSLRRRASLDHRALYVLSDPQDLSPVASNMRRFYKELRERTTSYYMGHGKRIKRWEGGLNPMTQMPLIARYRFKQAFLYEFMGNVEKCLKHYRRTFEALVEMMKLIGAHGTQVGHGSLGGSGYPLSSAMTMGGWASQVKGAVELVNFKICYYSMRETHHADAVRQFRTLMERFHWGTRPPPGSTITRSMSNSAAPLYGTPDAAYSEGSGSGGQRLDFLHHEWVCRQYELFGELLQWFPCPQLAGFGSTTGSGIGQPESDLYAEADLYIANAAMYMSKRRASAQALVQTPRASTSKYTVRLADNFGIQGPLIYAPYYVGGKPRLADPSLEDGLPEAEVANLIQAIMERDEACFDHSGAVRRLLMRALTVMDPGRPARHRFRATLHMKLAEELSNVEMVGTAWQHYCLAVRTHDEEKAGWPEATVSMLSRARLCALRLDKRVEYLDLSFKLLSNRLKGSLSPAQRRSLFLEALYLLTHSPDIEPVLQSSLAETPESFSVLHPDSGKYAGQDVPMPVVGALSQDVDSSGCMPLEPMCIVTPDSVEVSLECAWRQLLSFSLIFPCASASMGSVCPFTLRIVSHLPLPLHASSLELRFNKDYAGIITVLDPSPLTPTQRLSESWASPPPPPPDSLKSPRAKQPEHLTLDENKTVRASLLLLPEKPLDLRLSLPIPGENVEVGDVIHATLLKVCVALPPSTGEGSSVLGRGLLCLTMPSGVKYMDGLGVTNHYAVEEDHDGSLASQPVSIPVPIRAPVRGFPSVNVVRPTARATVTLAPSQPCLSKADLIPQSPRPPTTPRASTSTQPRAPSASRTLVSLVEHMHMVLLQVDSHEDVLEQPNLFVRCDPPPRSNKPEDAFFFTLAPDGSYTHIPLGKDLQPEIPLPVLQGGSQGHANIVPHSSVQVPIWYRPTREGRTRMNAVLVYKSVKGGQHQHQDLSSLMISSDLVLDVDSHSPFNAAFDVASPGPCEVHPKANSEGHIYSFFTGEEVVMRLSLRALQPAGFGHGGRVKVELVTWHLDDGLSSPSVVRGVSHTQLPKDGKVLFDAREAQHAGACSMQPNEVLSLCFHFLCPDKETAHPIRLGRIRVHWSLEDEGLGFKTSENYEPSERWLACSEMECPYVTVLRPDLAVDLEVPLQAKFGEAFPLRWTVLNTSPVAVSARVVIQDPSGPSENALLWGGKREFGIQLLPKRSVAVPLMLVPLATGPLALPKLSLQPVADSVSSFNPTATAFRVSYRFADNMPQLTQHQQHVTPETRQAIASDSRHIFVMPASSF